MPRDGYRGVSRRPGVGKSRRSSFRGVGSSQPPGLLASGGTFARTTEGSYLTGAPTTGASAFLAWAAADVRRIENRGDAMGSALLIEGPRTNVLLQTRDLAHASWSAGTAALTSDQNGGPDGANLADRVNATSAQFGPYEQSKTGTGQVRASIWCRAVSGTGTQQLVCLHNGATILAAKALATTTTWARNDCGGSATANHGMVSLDGRDQSAAGGQAATAQDCYLDLPQCEVGAFPSSPIRTTTIAVTRAVDFLTYAVGEYPSSYLTTGFRFIVALDCTSAELIAGAAEMRLFGVGANDFVRIRPNGGNCDIDLVCGGAIKGTLTVTMTSRALPLTITVQPSAGTLIVAGATTGNGTNTVAGAAWASGTLNVGTSSAGLLPMFGRIATGVVAL